MTVTKDGSIIDSEGKVIFFSTERFINDICLGDCCFICGVKPSEREFNNEHILSKWLLRRYSLFDRTITLPNGATVRYGQYTVSCCKECNSLMGEVIERPISQVVRKGRYAINDFASKDYGLKMFVWMGLIFLKTHLKDRTFRFHRDTRNGKELIADDYDWESLHHIHSVIRRFYTGCFVEKEAIGSFFTIPVKPQASPDRFDFGKLYQAQTMLLRLDDTAMLVVFDDAGCAMRYLCQTFERITGPVSEIQLHEIMAELAFLNLQLKERPQFCTEYDTVNDTCRIIGIRPKQLERNHDPQLRGKLMLEALRQFLPHMSVPNYTQEEVLEGIKSGNFSFLFNDDGEFITDGFTPYQPT
ncbi:hypothetical protein BCS42_01635 [Crenothrix sp. D3]|nr:hypothetical protein BCS42_01635 [Crenothrix sp. D3]